MCCMIQNSEINKIYMHVIHKLMSRCWLLGVGTRGHPLVANTHTFRTRFLVKAPLKFPTCLACHHNKSSVSSRINANRKPSQNEVRNPRLTDLLLDRQHNRVVIALEINLKLLYKNKTPKLSLASSQVGRLETKHYNTGGRDILSWSCNMASRFCAWI